MFFPGFLITSLLVSGNIKPVEAFGRAHLLKARAPFVAGSCCCSFMEAVCWVLAVWLFGSQATLLQESCPLLSDFTVGCALMSLLRFGGCITSGHSSIEEQFYLLWPPNLAFLLKRGVSRRGITVLVVVAIRVSDIWEVTLYVKGSPLRVFYGSDTRADTIPIGRLFGLLIHREFSSLQGWTGRGVDSVGSRSRWVLCPLLRR